MSRNYISKITKLLRDPSRARYIPCFLKQELVLWRGKSKASIEDISCSFAVSNLTEYDRVNGFKNEKDFIKEIMNEADEGDIFYDIGANIGTHSCFAGKAGAKVYGFEPFPNNVESLRKNFRLNHIDGEIFEVALMNENSEMQLTEGSGEAGEGKISVTENGELKTQVFRGDKFIERESLETPDVIKIDVEGAELEVLKGLEETLDSSSDLAIFIEIHPDRLPKFGGGDHELKDFLESLNFSIKELKTGRAENHIVASKHDNQVVG